jgi:hypothetical protein
MRWLVAAVILLPPLGFALIAAAYYLLPWPAVVVAAAGALIVFLAMAWRLWWLTEQPPRQ